jgi:acetyltransferase-like isoleucine patch superfamily enzyme
MKKIILNIIKLFNKLMYKNYNVEKTVHSQLVILKYGFFQKILGFNRNVPWPVHWTSTVYTPNRIIPGTRTPGLGKGCHIDGRNGIEIGKNVWIAPYVKIISMNHDVNDYHKYIKAKSIKIGNNCWLGSNAIILPEVELGEHTIVGAGSIVTKSFKEGNQVIGGNPAKIIKKLPIYGIKGE